MLPLLSQPQPAPASPASRTFLIEYSGESGDGNDGPCLAHNEHGIYCDSVGPEMHRPPAWTGPPLCACQDSHNNTYRCLRSLSTTANFIYCEFFEDFLAPQPFFHEHYSLLSDPWQLTNTYPTLPPATQQTLSTQLQGLASCTGSSCLAP